MQENIIKKKRPKKMRIEAKDLQSALTKAANEFDCSVLDVEYEIVQRPSRGFLGLFKKNAIIEARNKKKPLKQSLKPAHKNTDKKHKSENQKPIAQNNESKNTQKNNPPSVVDEISKKLKQLLQSSGLNIKLVELSLQDKDCIYIRLDGEDAALLIGKEAYRYKALSYLLHNWINSKFNLLVRLEIAEFLKNQEQGMQFYLKNIIEKVESTGRAQTKHLDGVLIKIALEQLRERFPNKYVGIKQNGEQRFVVVNDFFKKDESI